MTPICKAFGTTFLFGGILQLAQDILTFVQPQLLRIMIDFIQNSSKNNGNATANGSAYVTQDPMWHGIAYTVLLFVVASLQTLLLSQNYQRMFLVGLKIRTSLIGSIYKKALCLSNAAKKESTIGEITNLMSVDAQHLMDVTPYVNLIWSTPLQIGLALFFLWELLGVSAFAGEFLEKIRTKFKF